MQKSDCIIGVEHVSKYFGDKAVLNDVNLSVRKGEFVTILGPSGCGKTTLLRLIAGFQTASEGIITIAGKDITQTPPHQRPVNTVFQKYALFPHLNVYNNIAFGLKLKKMPEATIGKKVKQALRMVGMTDYEDRDVDSLSGGQQQRVAIARAIVNEPEVLLLDEPLAALDLKMRKDMQMELKEMHQKLGITFVYVTHDQEEALTRSEPPGACRNAAFRAAFWLPGDAFCAIATTFGEKVSSSRWRSAKAGAKDTGRFCRRIFYRKYGKNLLQIDNNM